MIINNPGDFGKGFLFFAFFAFSFIYVDGSIAFATTSVIVERGRGVFFSCPFCFIGHGVDVDANILPLSFLLTCFCFPPPCPFPLNRLQTCPTLSQTDEIFPPPRSILNAHHTGGVFFFRKDMKDRLGWLCRAGRTKEYFCSSPPLPFLVLPLPLPSEIPTGSKIEIPRWCWFFFFFLSMEGFLALLFLLCEYDLPHPLHCLISAGLLWFVTRNEKR